MLLVDCGPDVLINGSTFETFFPRPKPEGGFPNGKYNTFRYKKFNDGMDSVFVKEDIVLIKFCQVDNVNEIMERCSKKYNIWRKSIC